MSSPESKRRRVDDGAADGAAAATRIPAAPAPRAVAASSDDFERSIETLADELKARSACVDGTMKLSKRLRREADRAVHAFHSGDGASQSAALAAALGLAAELLASLATVPPSMLWLRTTGTVGGALQRTACAECLCGFMTSGRLPARETLVAYGDKEYLGGVIELGEVLGRYAVGRATLGDSTSVALCRDLLVGVNEQLLEFNFRNGPLRKRFDGLKWSVRRLQDLLYELSLSSHSSAVPGESAGAGAASLLERGDFEGCRIRMERANERREEVIKRTRDVQKHAKQAIFALHRGSDEGAEAHLTAAGEGARAINDELLASEPQLRSGAYANSIEELAEAELFKHWLSDGKPLSREQLAATLRMPVTAEEYLGGLGDLTGEVGRWAVAKATARDTAAVGRALEADLLVQSAMLTLGDTGLKAVDRKASAMRTNVKKLEHVLYELSLLKGTGRRTLEPAKEGNAPAARAGDGDDEA